MVTVVMLCANPYKTIAEGMATVAVAHKAEYNSLTKVQISLSYGLTYPENLMKEWDKEKHAATGGLFWNNAWSSYSVFKGTFNNGAKDTFLSSLVKVLRMIQNAIDLHSLWLPILSPMASSQCNFFWPGLRLWLGLTHWNRSMIFSPCQGCPPRRPGNAS
jgi:hypothetical protein